MKKYLTLIFIVTISLLMSCNKTGNAINADDAADTNIVNMANPMVEYQTTQDLYNACGFPFLNIDGLINGYSLSKMFFIAEDVVEINYVKDNATLCIRTAKGDKDISGLHYDETTETMQGFSSDKIIHKKIGDNIIGAWWTDGENSFSVSLKNGDESDFNTALNVAFVMAESLQIYNQNNLVFESNTTEVP